MPQVKFKPNLNKIFIEKSTVKEGKHRDADKKLGKDLSNKDGWVGIGNDIKSKEK